jgi:hypothetical protein
VRRDTRGHMRRLIGVLVVAVALGVVMSLVKGAGAGARDQFGNLSTPWLAMAFLGGASYRRVGRAAGAGVLATLAALAGFYGAQSPLADFSAGSLTFLGHPGQMYDFIVAPHLPVFVGGLLSGVVLGALGTMWSARRSPLAAAAIALLFVCEPFAWIASGSAIGGSDPSRYWWIWLAEIAVGLTAMVAIVRARRAHEQA